MILGKNPAPAPVPSPAQLRLTGEDLVLREWTENDFPAMTELFDDPEIAHWTPPAFPFDETAAGAYLAAARQARAEGLRIQLAITADGQLPLGEVLVIRHNANDRTARLGYSVGAAHRGRRVGARAAGYHLTYEPAIAAIDKGRSLALRTRAHDSP
ncbi:GNAT family N-acetyltransferase [Streptomyces sp. NPDC051642]|uniref:GNAT family N-acetyltransferase n=1 Tax=Streptomyces sp. NPDC051642 TaxID=3154646 RepID=UPI0034139200